MVTIKELLKDVVPAYTKKINAERKKKGLKPQKQEDVMRSFKYFKKSSLQSRYNTLKSQGFIK